MPLTKAEAIQAKKIFEDVLKLQIIRKRKRVRFDGTAVLYDNPTGYIAVSKVKSLMKKYINAY